MTNPLPAFSLLAKPAGLHCPLECSYCDRHDSEEGERMTSKEAISMVEGYRLASSTESYIWSGGEPSQLGWAFFQAAVKAQGPHAMNALQTNGLAFSRRDGISWGWRELLKGKGNWIVGLSHDGPNNSSRGINTKRLDCAARNLRRAEVPFSLMCVVSDANVNRPSEVVEHFYRSEFGDAPIQFMHAKGSKVTGLEYGNFLGAALAATPDRGKRLANYHAFEAAWAGPKHVTTCENLEQCGTYLMVEGFCIYPCDHFNSAEHLLDYVDTVQRRTAKGWCEALTNAWNSSARAEWLKLKTAWQIKCVPCSVRSACQMGCPADYDKFGLSTICAANAMVAHITHPARAGARPLR